MSDAVLYHAEDAIGVITLNRPDNRNSMTPELLDAFAAATCRAREDNSLRCVVITGKGNCFSAGADFKSQIQRDDGGRTLQPYERSYAMYEPFLSVLDIEVPVLAALNGHTVGGGFGLALVCDVRIGNSGSKYGANFCKLGLHPGMAISYTLPRLIGMSRAAELMFTGRLMLGEEAASVGFLSRAVAADDVMPATMEMAKTIAGNAPIAVRMTKATLYRGLEHRVREAAMNEAFSQAVTVATEDMQEGIKALLEKRDPEFHGR